MFKVLDTTGEFVGSHALKRVSNPNRHDRFKAEVESLRRLNHPNIIPVIQHSMLREDPSEDVQDQWIVMPFAWGGDLAKRRARYKDNPTGVINVAIKLAEALRAAHAAQVIHRDVKPENILFVSDDDEDGIWLADFGIAHLQDMPRHTAHGEIVGPAHFIAPELESRGQHEVPPAADVYSLGKVIYYMLSGGVVLRREWLHKDEYGQLFDGKGEQYLEFYQLLSAMICERDNRFADMTSVLEKLQKIRAWSSNAEIPFSLVLNDTLGRLKLRNIEVKAERVNRSEIVRKRNYHTGKVVQLIAEGIERLLEALANRIQDPYDLSASVSRKVHPTDGPVTGPTTPIESVEISVRNTVEHPPRERFLRFTISTVRHNTGLIFTRDEPPMPEEFDVLQILPSYKTEVPGHLHNNFWLLFSPDGNTFSPRHPFDGGDSDQEPFSVQFSTRDSSENGNDLQILTNLCTESFVGRIFDRD